MVKLLSHSDKEALGTTIAEVKLKTSAEVIVIVAPASDVYQEYSLLLGLCFGSLVDTFLWATKMVMAFPYLLILLLGFTALFMFVPLLRFKSMRVVPRHVQHHRAAQRASEEYLIVTRRLLSSTPVIVLYLSVAERYAHVLTSRLVREHLPDERWNAVIRELTASIKASGIGFACIKAVEHATNLLASHFPAGSTGQVSHSRIMEIGTSS